MSSRASSATRLRRCLDDPRPRSSIAGCHQGAEGHGNAGGRSGASHGDRTARPVDRDAVDGAIDRPSRSEEHTSELQSLMRSSYAVFCMKKKTKRTSAQQDRHILHKSQQQTTLTNKYIAISMTTKK